MQGKRRLPEQGAFAKLVEQQICFHDALLVREREDEDAVPALLGVELRQMSRVQQTARFLEVESEREGERQNFCARGILVAGKDMVGVCGFESRGADDIAFRSILLREKLREIIMQGHFLQMLLIHFYEMCDVFFPLEFMEQFVRILFLFFRHEENPLCFHHKAGEDGRQANRREILL